MHPQRSSSARATCATRSTVLPVAREPAPLRPAPPSKPGTSPHGSARGSPSRHSALLLRPGCAVIAGRSSRGRWETVSVDWQPVPTPRPPLRPTACARAPATSLLSRPLAVLSYPGWLPSLVPKQRPPAPGSSPSVQTKHGGDMGETRVTSIAKGGSHPGILRPSPCPAAGAVDPDSCLSCPYAALAP